MKLKFQMSISKSMEIMAVLPTIHNLLSIRLVQLNQDWYNRGSSIGWQRKTNEKTL